LSDLFPNIEVRRGRVGWHEEPQAKTHIWLTPPYIIDALGPFDLDPCAAPEPRPWDTAKTHWGRGDNSLGREWTGRVWLNPPYGPPPIIGPWLRRMKEHNHGTALIFARTETALFFKTVWPVARAALFLKGRLTFYRPDGTHPGTTRDHGGAAGAPSVLVAYGEADAIRLRECGLPGHFVNI